MGHLWIQLTTISIENALQTTKLKNISTQIRQFDCVTGSILEQIFNEYFVYKTLNLIQE